MHLTLSSDNDNDGNANDDDNKISRHRVAVYIQYQYIYITKFQLSLLLITVLNWYWIYSANIWGMCVIWRVSVRPSGAGLGNISGQECTFSYMYTCIGYKLPTFGEYMLVGGFLCALRAQGWGICRG